MQALAKRIDPFRPLAPARELYRCLMVHTPKKVNDGFYPFLLVGCTPPARDILNLQTHHPFV